MMPKISVVMSCYNAQQHIKQAIDSILNQTFQDFEFIIWDDGSTDSTKYIIDSYSDSRIHYYYHENTGLGQALRFACEKATTPIIARMDADDISLPTRFQLEYEYLANHPEVILVSSAVIYIDENGNELGRSFPYMSDKALRNILLSGHSAISHPSVMFRRETYIKSGGYMPLRKAQDLHLFARMAQYGKMHNLAQTLLMYRISENSISTQTSDSSYLQLISCYLKKMANDSEINQDDIVIYNSIVKESKKKTSVNIKATNFSRYNLSMEEKMYRICASFVGKRIAELFIQSLKNVYGFITLR